MKRNIFIMITTLMFFSCAKEQPARLTVQEEQFDYNVEQFADLGVLRYQVTDWDSLSLQQKSLIYCLNEAALYGRDILFDQNNRYNLAIRRTLEAVYANYKGDTASADYQAFAVYLKRVWFSNGIHHHYGEEKFLPGFSKEFFTNAVKSLDSTLVPRRENQSVDTFLDEIIPVMFQPELYAKKVNQDSGIDVIAGSANNYYGEGVTQKEVELFYNAMKNPNDSTPVPFGLNSRLIKKDGKLVEEIYKTGGLYSPAIEKIVYWLEEAGKYAENPQQKKAIELLVDFYKTGDLKKYDEYSIAWVKDTESVVDFVNGFTESYGDALGLKASWEALVNFKDLQATAKTKVISENAQWFEDHSPVAPQFKKENVKGVSAKTITATILGGDCYPATPIGINLPNSNWIRKEYGSKSVTISNITEAYDKAAAGNGFLDEFVCCPAEKEIMEKFGSQTDNLHTDLHECLGHASGQLLPGVNSDALNIYGSTIEEARADLFGLYYIPDPKILEIGLLNNPEAYKAEYYKYMMNGLITQLSRIEPGKQIEEAHMRNRSLIAHWVLERGQANKVAELVKKDGKTYVVINDYEKMRTLIGELLAEVQRIKSEGDFAAAKQLVEQYGVKVDLELHKEVRERYDKLGIAPYKGFVNPVYEAVKDKQGNIIDIRISYKEGYAEQMMRYSEDYSPLPTYNGK
ncbi:MAG: dipeptidyl peptidase 3 [Dysgonamonadaceae bacterium]|jgi:dipeptidyl-peptidase-3|nr:dipeptidyl peptidase 3 [Dysgonamonadaceae bacterium]